MGDFGCVLGGQATKSTVCVRPKDIFCVNFGQEGHLPTQHPGFGSKLSWSKTTKLILLDSLLQEVVATLLHLVFQKPSTAKMESSSHYSWDGEYTA
jgi:hypothetical protein